MRTELYKNLCSALPLFFMCLGIYGQTGEFDTRTKELSALQMAELTTNTGNGLLSNNGPTTASAAISKGVYIQQVGVDNLVNAQIRGEGNILEIVQNGSSNIALFDTAASTMAEKVLQNGDHNFFTEYANTPNLDLGRAVIQNGNGNNIAIYGSNSLTENLRLNLQGNAMSVTIRNFN